ncbi:adhesion G protein-coupled receptor E3-like, partial [Clarias magur]
MFEHSRTPLIYFSIEIQVFMVGQYVNLTKIPTLITKNATMDMDLIGISKNNYGSAAVVFMSYNNITGILDPSFVTFTATNKTVMSVVVSATLPETYNTTLTEPVNFTLKHIK